MSHTQASPVNAACVEYACRHMFQNMPAGTIFPGCGARLNFLAKLFDHTTVAKKDTSMICSEAGVCVVLGVKAAIERRDQTLGR